MLQAHAIAFASASSYATAYRPPMDIPRLSEQRMLKSQKLLPAPAPKHRGYDMIKRRALAAQRTIHQQPECF